MTTVTINRLNLIWTSAVSFYIRMLTSSGLALIKKTKRRYMLSASGHVKRIIREATEIEPRPDTMKREPVIAATHSNPELITGRPSLGTRHYWSFTGPSIPHSLVPSSFSSVPFCSLSSFSRCTLPARPF